MGCSVSYCRMDEMVFEAAVESIDSIDSSRARSFGKCGVTLAVKISLIRYLVLTAVCEAKKRQVLSLSDHRIHHIAS